MINDKEKIELKLSKIDLKQILISLIFYIKNETNDYDDENKILIEHEIFDDLLDVLILNKEQNIICLEKDLIERIYNCIVKYEKFQNNKKIIKDTLFNSIIKNSDYTLFEFKNYSKGVL